MADKCWVLLTRLCSNRHRLC
uniref:Uncharacterized protein n=1 Tax=Anguilla anguilla TaxID=7936 RepID=A0A0E9PWD4_ANGAN